MNNIYKQVSEELNLPIEYVKQAYESFYKYIRIKISELDINNINEDTQVNFNIPSLGKLYCNKNKLKKINKNVKNNRKTR